MTGTYSLHSINQFRRGISKGSNDLGIAIKKKVLYLRLHQEPRKGGHQPSTKAAVV